MIPWGHNRLIISKVKNIEEAEFYCQAIMALVIHFTHYTEQNINRIEYFVYYFA